MTNKKNLNQKIWKQSVPENSGIVVGLSGGADSLFCLLYLIFEESLLSADSKEELLNSKRSNYQVVGYNAAYLGRGDEAREDVDFLAAICKELDLPFEHDFFGDEDVEGIGNLEADLRMWRYDRMVEFARKRSMQAVAVGHHQDDVAESFLLMTLRGSGPRGLGSLREVRELAGGIKLLRPLLSFGRDQIRELLSELNFEWREDSMNADGLVRRNVLRHQVFPVLNELEVSTSKLFAQTARLCAAEHDLLEKLIVEKYSDLIVFQNSDSVLLKSESLSEFEETEFLAFLRAVMTSFAAQKIPSIKELQTLFDHVSRLEKHEMEFPFRCGIYGLLTNQYIFLTSKPDEAKPNLCRGMVALGFSCFFADKNKFAKTELRYSKEDQLSDQNHTFFSVSVIEKIEYKKISKAQKLVVESGSEKSVSDLFSAQKIPRMIRDDAFAFVDRETKEILWIPGIRRTANYHLEEDESCIEIRFVGTENDAG